MLEPHKLSTVYGRRSLDPDEFTRGFRVYSSLRVQVPNSHILTQDLYYNYQYQNPKYPIIGYMEP